VNSTVYVGGAGTYYAVNGVCRKISSTGNAGSWWRYEVDLFSFLFFFFFLNLGLYVLLLSSSFFHFSWLPFASYNGQVYIDGRGPCDEWILHVPSKGVLVLDVINGTLPVRFIAPGSQSITVSCSTSCSGSDEDAHRFLLEPIGSWKLNIFLQSRLHCRNIHRVKRQHLRPASRMLHHGSLPFGSSRERDVLSLPWSQRLHLNQHQRR